MSSHSRLKLWICYLLGWLSEHGAELPETFYSAASAATAPCTLLRRQAGGTR